MRVYSPKPTATNGFFAEAEVAVTVVADEPPPPPGADDAGDVALTRRGRGEEEGTISSSSSSGLVAIAILFFPARVDMALGGMVIKLQSGC